MPLIQVLPPSCACQTGRKRVLSPPWDQAPGRAQLPQAAGLWRPSATPALPIVLRSAVPQATCRGHIRSESEAKDHVET